MICKILAQDSVFILRYKLFVKKVQHKMLCKIFLFRYILPVNVGSTQNALQTFGPGFHISNLLM